LWPEFKGTAFDFASLHYKLTGEALLEKISLDLNLRNGDGERETGDGETEMGKGEPETGYLPPLVIDLPRFSFYRYPITNTRPAKLVTLLDVFKLIRGDAYKARTQALRSIKDPAAASQFKRNQLDYVTFSGVFSKRSEWGLVSQSGLMVLDFDKLDKVALVKETLLNDPESELDFDMMFTSPSGRGLKCVISIDVVKEPHLRWFAGVSSNLKERYKLEVDQSGKDRSRACFLCHDPEAWIHPLYAGGHDVSWPYEAAPAP
jgi:hypothetical protein